MMNPWTILLLLLQCRNGGALKLAIPIRKMCLWEGGQGEAKDHHKRKSSGAVILRTRNLWLHFAGENERRPGWRAVWLVQRKRRTRYPLMQKFAQKAHSYSLKKQAGCRNKETEGSLTRPLFLLNIAVAFFFFILSSAERSSKCKFTFPCVIK